MKWRRKEGVKKHLLFRRDAVLLWTGETREVDSGGREIYQYKYV